MSSYYESYMKEALALADEAASLLEVPVGAVVIRNGEIIGKGFNRRETNKNALAHAEIEAIQAACETIGSWRLSGCELIVTLEPCPMCAGAIINSRLDKVVFGAFDKKAGSLGSVVDLFALPYNHKPLVISGILEKECSEILTSFFLNLRKNKL